MVHFLCFLTFFKVLASVAQVYLCNSPTYGACPLGKATLVMIRILLFALVWCAAAMCQWQHISKQAISKENPMIGMAQGTNLAPRVASLPAENAAWDWVYTLEETADADEDVETHHEVPTRPLAANAYQRVGFLIACQQSTRINGVGPLALRAKNMSGCARARSQLADEPATRG